MAGQTKVKCRLCVIAHNEYKSLYDESGQGNDIYEITLKYFDPMLLSPAHIHDTTVICLECWSHISEFYGFQQSILQAQADLQTLLSADIKQDIIDTKVKLEEELLIGEQPIEIVETTHNVCSVDELKDEKEISDLEDHYERHNNPITFSSSSSDDDDDDEKPLITHIIKGRKKRKYTRKAKDEEKNNDEQKESDEEESVKKKTRKNKKLNAPKETTTKAARKKRNTKSKDKESIQNVREANEEQDINATASAAELDDGPNDTANAEKKSVKDKTIECDAFIAQWKQELECVCCPTTVSNFTLLRKHYRAVHPKEKCYVVCCQRKFYHRFHIVEHIRLHIDPSVFQCDECGKCSTNSRNLAKHKREMHTEEGKQRPFECDVCHKRFSNKTILRTHMEVHENGRDHICSECGKGFPSENRRKIHERMVHQADRICDQCGKTLHGVYALKLHLLEHAGIQKPKWPCDQCNAQLHSHSSLKRHKLITHHDGSTVYICSDCGKIFTSENALRSHKRIVHLIERKFKCNICEKAFKFPKILREHMASHTGEDLYQCPYCPKTFKVSANMHHHRKKAHPKEWAEARINKPVSNKVDISLVSNEIIM